MANAANDREEPDTATLEHCLAIVRELEPRLIATGNKWRTHEMLGETLFRLGRYTEALPYAQASLRHFEPSSYRSPWGIVAIGFILGGLGDYRTAVMLVAAGQRGNEEQGPNDFTPVDRRELHRFEASAREELGLSAYEAAVSEGEALSVEEASDLVLSEPDANEIVADTEGHEAASH
jgi:hypothetical protein